MTANCTPAPATLDQSIVFCQWETSMPGSIPAGVRTGTAALSGGGRWSIPIDPDAVAGRVQAAASATKETTIATPRPARI